MKNAILATLALGGLLATGPSAAAGVDNFIYTSTLSAPGATAAAQLKGIVKDLKAALKKEGVSVDRAVHLTVYVRTRDDVAAVDQAFKDTWPSAPPARTALLANPMEPFARVALSAVAVRAGLERRAITPNGWAQPKGGFSYAVLAGNTLFLSGLSASTKEASPAATTVGAQTHIALTTASDILKAAGMTCADAVSSRVFVAEAAMFEPMNVEYRPFFTKDPPARATVRASFLNAGDLMQVTLVAARSTDREIVHVKRADGTFEKGSPNYSVGVRVGNRLYGAGTVGGDNIPQGDIRAHARQSLAEIGKAVQAGGFSWDHVAHVLVYLTHADDKAGLMDVLRETMPRAHFTVALVETGLVIPNPRLEIMLTAVK